MSGRESKPGEVSFGRRAMLKTAMAAGVVAGSGCVTEGARKMPETAVEDAMRVGSPKALADALQICANTYPANRRKDVLSSFNKTGYRMTVSPNGFPVAICMCPDLTFGLLGSRFVRNRDYLDTFRGHLDHLPRNMRRNGKFFINEDQLAGADRVFTQVMYPIWIWELYRATRDKKLLEFHRDPLTRCLGYIESRTDERGIVNQVDADDWQYSEGADWVDWCPERMEGSTCVYHTWYAHALGGCVPIFRKLGDEKMAAACEERQRRQRDVLDRYFWNGKAYWDNVNFQGEKVGRFWCDSQIWPIAYGYASSEQASSIFGRIDSEPEVFEGVPLRWCAPITPGDEDPRYLPGGKYGDTPRPELREFSWFGRLGAGDIVARYRTGQADHALKLILRYADVISGLGTAPECLDMKGKPQEGTGGAGNYLEHAGGFLWCVGRGMFGIDDADGTLTWTPRFPVEITEAKTPFWYMDKCWEFGCDADTYWFDPHSAHAEVRLVLDGEQSVVQVKGARMSWPRRRT